MYFLNFPIFIDFSKFILYIEPSFFLFFGKAGAFKTILFRPLLLNYVRNVITILLSPIALINRILKHIVRSISYHYIAIKTFNFICSIPFHDIYTYHKYMCKYFFFLKRLFLQIISSIHRGWVKRLRLVGIGYKLYSHSNLLILKLGYSKCIFFSLPLDIRITVTGRKKRRFSLFSIDKMELTLVSKLLLQLRIPNIYTGKGIRIRGISFIRKLGKKSLF